MNRRLPHLVLAAALVLGVIAPATAPTAHADVPTAARLFMVSDSVGLGAANAINAAFPGWQVTVSGKPGLFTEQLVSYVNSAPASAFGDSAIVATGYNYPYWDPPRFDRSIDLMIAALEARGVQRIFWVTMREVTPTFYRSWNSLAPAYRTLYEAYPGANNQLRMATLRHPSMSIIDWASIADQPDITYDAIHLNPTGAAKYAGLAVGAVVNAATRRPAGTVTEIPVAGLAGVPGDALAVSLNLTVVNPRTAGYLSVFPCGGETPLVSNLNYRAAATVASSAVVPIGVDGKVCLLQSSAAHVVVDVTGAFATSSGFLPLSPHRAADTRDTQLPAAGQVTTVHLGQIPGAPSGQFTAVVNLTGVAAVNAELRIYPCDGSPSLAPTRTVEGGMAQTLDLLVATDGQGDVCVVTTGNVQVIVDLFGAFPPSADAHPQTSVTVYDSRFVAPLAPLVDRLVALPFDSAPAGVVLTVTAVGPASNGYITAFPCSAGGTPTSVLNVVPDHGQSNSVILGVDPGGTVCVRSSVTTHVSVDITGRLGAGYLPLAPARLVDTRL